MRITFTAPFPHYEHPTFALKSELNTAYFQNPTYMLISSDLSHFAKIYYDSINQMLELAQSSKYFDIEHISILLFNSIQLFFKNLSLGLKSRQFNSDSLFELNQYSTEIMNHVRELTSISTRSIHYKASIFCIFSSNNSVSKQARFIHCEKSLLNLMSNFHICFFNTIPNLLKTHPKHKSE
jgi:hypothetical protein